jgi:hypothetical protein
MQLMMLMNIILVISLLELNKEVFQDEGTDIQVVLVDVHLLLVNIPFVEDDCHNHLVVVVEDVQNSVVHVNIRGEDGVLQEEVH